tara:strand:+ start:421 stop:531 length:111 start_codon:yes stop_codon:yes gene_type:complete
MISIITPVSYSKAAMVVVVATVAATATCRCMIIVDD